MQRHGRLSGKDWQLADALLGRSVESVAQRGCERRHGRLTDAGGSLVTLDEVGFNRRDLVHAQDRVGIEVRLLNLAVFDCDLAAQCRRQSEDDGAVELLLENVGVDDLSAIDSDDDALDMGIAILHGDFDDFGGVSPKASEGGDAAMTASGEWTSPSGFFGDQLQYTAQAIGSPLGVEVGDLFVL